MNLRQIGAVALCVAVLGSVGALANSYNNSNGSVTPGFRIEIDGTGTAAGTSGKPLNVTTIGSALPSGASTAANQTAPQAPVTPATATATKSLLMGCVYTAAGVTFTNTQQGAAQCDAAGRYLVSIGDSKAFAPIAAATATATKSVLLGGQYDSTQKTLTNGQQAAASFSARGALMVNPGAETFNVTVNAALPAGTALLGKTGIDQTTPGTTNGVVPLPSSVSGAALTPVSSSALAANTVIKAGAGNLYGFQVSADSTLYAAAWWIMVYDATSAPVDGAVTPKKCYAQPLGTQSAAYAWPMPIAFSTGIVIGVSTTGCFSKTASTHAFISGDAQ